MNTLRRLYRHSLGLLTDLYQITMAYGYWHSGSGGREAVFHLFYRNNPFHGGFTIAAGLATALDFLEDFSFAADDLNYLATLQGNDGKPMFQQAFLDYLSTLRLSCEVSAVPEGTVMFPHAPLLRVRGPLLQCQLLESALLNIINFQSLIATKAARVCAAAQGDAVLEFGLRRAQGIDGALAASRAAYIGGCAATSNILAGKLYGIPVKGTHAHSWVMSFANEQEAFDAYAYAMPNNCVFLVDTYDTLDGVRHAVDAGRRLRALGHEMLGIRLDSGNLVELSNAARILLDEGGFPNAAIIASNDLDEHLIQDLKAQGAQIAIWGVGTKLVTAHDQPALGGVYKLAAIRDPDGEWEYRIKLSQDPIKVSLPGILQVRRYRTAEKFCGDVIYLEGQTPTHAQHFNSGEAFTLSPEADSEDLLIPVFRNGRRVHESPPLSAIRARAHAQLSALPKTYQAFQDAAVYPVGLETHLAQMRTDLCEAQHNTKDL
jgi:nicotinate phosphoribosyltransferase